MAFYAAEMRRDEPIVIYSVVPGEPHPPVDSFPTDQLTDARTGQDSILVLTLAATMSVS